MSDFNRIDRQELDNYITGHYGEDQFRDYGPEVAFPDVHVQLSEQGGNVFSIIGRVYNALKRTGHADGAKVFVEEAMKLPSYDAVLQLVMRTVQTS